MLAVSTTAVIAVLAFAAAAALVTIALARRRSPSAETSDHLAKAVDEMRLKMDELSQDLSQALERAERESRRNRLFGELGGSIDLQELMDRVLDAAMEITGFDAAMIVVEGHGAAPIVVTRAMTPEETEKPPTSGVVGALPGTITVTYRYGRDRETPDSDRICGGLFIPLIGRDLAPIGTLSLFWRDPDFEPPASTSSGPRTSPRAASPRSRTRAGTARRASSPRRTR